MPASSRSSRESHWRSLIPYAPPSGGLLIILDAFRRIDTPHSNLSMALVELLVGATAGTLGTGIVNEWGRRNTRKEQEIKTLGIEMAHAYRDITNTHFLRPEDSTPGIQGTAMWFGRTAMSLAVAEVLEEQAHVALELPEQTPHTHAALQRLIEANTVARDTIIHELSIPNNVLTTIFQHDVVTQAEITAMLEAGKQEIKARIRENMSSFQMPDSAEPLTLVSIAELAMRRIQERKDRSRTRSQQRQQ